MTRTEFIDKLARELAPIFGLTVTTMRQAVSTVVHEYDQFQVKRYDETYAKIKKELGVEDD